MWAKIKASIEELVGVRLGPRGQEVIIFQWVRRYVGRRSLVGEPKGRWSVLGRQLFGTGSQRSLDDHIRIVIANPIEGVDRGVEVPCQTPYVADSNLKKQPLQCHSKGRCSMIWCCVVPTPFHGVENGLALKRI
jgi:hypothetical protein